MEIAKEKTLLSNAEVLWCVEEQRPPKRTKQSRILGQFPFIQSHVRSYIKTTAADTITPEKVEMFLKDVDEFEKSANIHITKAERMQLLNIVPMLPVDIYLIIEECPERLNESQVNDLLEIIKKDLM
ncbi:hypothetical protein WA158_007105 [Blastocystis sp. Blastoise]